MHLPTTRMHPKWQTLSGGGMNYNVDAPNYNAGASPPHATTIATTIAATIVATIAATIAAQKGFFRVAPNAFTRNL